jgi:hypothetical protein
MGRVMLWWTAPAAACLAPAQTYTLDGAYPAPDASNVPTNAPLVLHMVAPPAGVFVDGGLTSTPLSDATAHEVVPVIAMALGPRDAQVFSFVPVQPLQPHTTYVVDLGKPPGTSGPTATSPNVTWQFTTGESPAAALRLKGDLSISYEPGTDPHYDCSDGQSLCGPCTIDGNVNVTKARVALPASFDGFSAQGVQAALRVYEPLLDGKTGAWTEINPIIIAGEVGEALVTMPLRDDGMAYAPCFQFEVTDAGGVRTTQLQCLDAPFPLPEGTTLGAVGEGAMDDNTASSSAPPTRTSTACSFARPARGASTSAFMIGMLLLTAGRRLRGRRNSRRYWMFADL